MRIGLIGQGPQGKRYLAPANGGEHITRVLTRLDRDLGNWGGLDGVVIATHPSSHHSLVMQALAHGLHVLCEKPLCLNKHDLKEILKARDNANRRLMVAHTHLYSEAFQQVRKDYAPLNKSRRLSIWWGGPRERHMHIPPSLDWGCHARAMAYALGAERLEMIARDQPYRTRRLVIDGELAYTGDEPCERSAMWHMMEAFANGDADDTEEELRAIYEPLFLARDEGTL